jgi:phage head maturation protease
MMIERTAPCEGEETRRDHGDAVVEKAKDDNGVRRAVFVASDESVDRYGDIIRASGWKLDNFRKNSVLLYGHQAESLSIGKVPAIGVEGTRLLAHVEWAKPGTTAFADSAWALLEQGMLNAVSVGFLPLARPLPIFDADQNVTGFEFIAQDLLELSVVVVPANPNALQIAKDFGLSASEMRRLFDDGTAARHAVAARTRILTLSRLGRHQAAPTPHMRGD